MGTCPASESERRSLGPDFDSLLLATGVSNLGDGIRLAALPLLATTLTASPVLIAGVTAAQFLPWMIVGPVAGVIVDRTDRRRLILRTQAWRAAVMLGLAGVVAAGEAQMWMLFIVAFVITVGEILVDPSVVAVVPTVVERRDLDRANGRISSTELVANDVVGAPIGAALFLSRPSLPFVVDSISYLGSIVLFRRLPRPEPGPARARLDLRTATAELPVGARWIRGHPMLAPWTAGVAMFNLGAAAGFSLLVVLLLATHEAAEFTYAVALTIAALAGAAASTIAARLVQRWGRRRVLLSAAGISSFVMLVLAAAENATTVVVAWGAGGAASGVLLAIGRGFIQRHTPDDVIGRAVIASRTITRTAFVVGAVSGGLIADHVGLRAAYVVGAAAQIAALVPMALALRHDRE